MKLIKVFQRIMVSVNQFLALSKDDGFFNAIKRAFKKLYRHFLGQNYLYRRWQKRIEILYLNEDSMKRDFSNLKKIRKFSILFPVYNKDISLIDKALDSIISQSYTNWEICISDGSTKNVEKTRFFLKEFADKFGKKVRFSTIDIQGINIIENTNNTLRMATGEYVVFMDCDDEISKNCLLELAKSIERNPKVEFLYSDFDHIDLKGKRYSPSFWPDWSPHRLLSQMYTTHVTCYKKSVIDRLGGLRKGTEGAQDWDLTLRYSLFAKRDKVIHIPKILYHWRAYEDSTAMSGNQSKNWAHKSQIKAIGDYLEAKGYKSIIQDGAHKGIFNTEIKVQNSPKVSIVIAFRDKIDYLKKCVESIKAKTQYKNYEIVLVNNQSVEQDTYKFLNEVKEVGIKVLNYDKSFHFGKMYNWACKQLDSDYLLILNNDIEVITNGWLEKMLGYSQLEEVGCVGAKLLYPDMRVQHAGVLVGHRGTAGHIQVLSKDSDTGYLSSLVVTRNVLALTAACLIIKKDKFFNAGGFEESLDPAYQDVDLCMKLYEQGLYNIYLPFVKLIHYESLSRLDPKLSKNLTPDSENAIRLKKKWPQYIRETTGRDPFYNENLSYNESDCRIRAE